MNTESSTADYLVAETYDLLCNSKLDDARVILSQGLLSCPEDSRFHVLAAVVDQVCGDARGALRCLWAALAAEPGSHMASDELRRLAVTPQTDPAGVCKDFSLDSGERQTASQANHIRADHRARYAMAARWLRQRGHRSWDATGLDLFCGNGYGSHMLGQLAGVRMLGIDGSIDAVNLATRAYGSHRVQFAHAIFPFELTPRLFDFAVSFESIEHVDDAEGLLEQMARATEGPFIISVPHEPGLPFQDFGHRFEHHVRHFHRAEILDLLAKFGRDRVLAEYGQDVYRVRERDIVGLVPESEMGLRRFDPHASQFLIMIVDRS